MTRSSGFTLNRASSCCCNHWNYFQLLEQSLTTGYVKGAKKSSAENYLQQISLAQTEYYSSTGEYLYMMVEHLYC